MDNLRLITLVCYSFVLYWSWNRMELVKATLWSPSVFGWSGTLARYLSTPSLNFLMSSCVGSIRYCWVLSSWGRILNSLGPLLKKDAPLTVCTQSGAFKLIFGGICIPFLLFCVTLDRSKPGLGYVPIIILYKEKDHKSFPSSFKAINF